MYRDIYISDTCLVAAAATASPVGPAVGRSGPPLRPSERPI